MIIRLIKTLIKRIKRTFYKLTRKKRRKLEPLKYVPNQRYCELFITEGDSAVSPIKQ